MKFNILKFLSRKCKSGENCSPNISKDFLKKKENKYSITNPRRKYFAGELSESCNYYEQAKKNFYRAPNLGWQSKIKLITNPISFLNLHDRNIFIELLKK